VIGDGHDQRSTGMDIGRHSAGLLVAFRGYSFAAVPSGYEVGGRVSLSVGGRRSGGWAGLDDRRRTDGFDDEPLLPLRTFMPVPLAAPCRTP